MMHDRHYCMDVTIIGEIWEMMWQSHSQRHQVSTTIGLSGLKCTKMGAWVKAFLRVSNALVWSGPRERSVLAHETNQGDDNVGEPHNELVIEVGGSKNAWTALRLVGVGQMLTVPVLVGVHGDAVE